MAKHKTESSKTHNKPSRIVEHKKEALSSPPQPPVERYVPIDDLQEGAYLSRPAAARPAITAIYWVQERVPEYVRIQLQALHHFKIDPTKPNSYPKHDAAVAHFKTVRLSNGQLISENEAKRLATFIRPVDARRGGNKKKG